MKRLRQSEQIWKWRFERQMVCVRVNQRFSKWNQLTFYCLDHLITELCVFSLIFSFIFPLYFLPIHFLFFNFPFSFHSFKQISLSPSLSVTLDSLECDISFTVSRNDGSYFALWEIMRIKMEQWNLNKKWRNSEYERMCGVNQEEKLIKRELRSLGMKKHRKYLQSSK